MLLGMSISGYKQGFVVDVSQTADHFKKPEIKYYYSDSFPHRLRANETELLEAAYASIEQQVSWPGRLQTWAKDRNFTNNLSETSPFGE